MKTLIALMLPLLLLAACGDKPPAPAPDNHSHAHGNAGHTDHPAWWLNLQRHPHAAVQTGSVRRAVVASEVDGSERDRLWRSFAEMYEGLDTYQRQATRRFPVVRLKPEPRSHSPATTGPRGAGT